MRNPIRRALRFLIFSDFDWIFNRPDLPLGFRILHYTILASVVPWPVLILASMFLIDIPESQTKASHLIMLVIIYPYLLLLFTIASFKSYGKNLILAYIFPFISAAVIGYIIYKFYSF